MKRLFQFVVFAVALLAAAQPLLADTACAEKTVAVVDHLGLRRDPECFKEIRIGKTAFKRYSPRAIDRIQQLLKVESADTIWAKRNKTA